MLENFHFKTLKKKKMLEFIKGMHKIENFMGLRPMLDLKQSEMISWNICF